VVVDDVTCPPCGGCLQWKIASSRSISLYMPVLGQEREFHLLLALCKEERSLVHKLFMTAPP